VAESRVEIKFDVIVDEAWQKMNQAHDGFQGGAEKMAGRVPRDGLDP